eukprot:Rhum_TRINITY_DN25108_c0_g1::Rhum_TRINITY_DN25108_c0_g1_i1::g.181333::m.181333
MQRMLTAFFNEDSHPHGRVTSRRRALLDWRRPDTRDNRHCHELLEEKLAAVRDQDLRDLRRRPAVSALERVLLRRHLRLEIRNGKQAAPVAHVHPVVVRHVEKPLLHPRRRSVRNHAVALHLSEPQTAVLRPTLRRLLGQTLQGTACPGMDLVLYHVLQALVVRRSQEDLVFERQPGVSAVHHFVATKLVPKTVQLLANFLNVETVDERRGISFNTLAAGHLAEKRLEQVSDCHARRDGVGVHDDVRHNALLRERHVFLAEADTQRPLLTVAAAELVADLRDTDGPHLDLHEAVAALVGGEHHTVDDTTFGHTQAHRRVLVLVLRLHRHVGLRQRRSLADNDVATGHTRPGHGQTVLVQLVVRRPLQALRHLRVRLRELLASARPQLLRGLVAVRAIEAGTEEAAVDGAAVHDDTVLLVVPGVARDGHNGVVPGGQVVRVHVTHRLRTSKRLVRVVKHVRCGVVASKEVADVHAHGLLAHRGLVRVPRRLVVVGEGDNRGTDAEDHGRMDFAMSVRGVLGLHNHTVLVLLALHLQSVLVEGNHDRVLLLHVDQVDQLALHQLRPRQQGVLIVLVPLVLDVLLADTCLVPHDVVLVTEVVHNEQRPRQTSGVRPDAKLPLLQIPDNRHLLWQVLRPTLQLEVADHRLRVGMDADPVTVDEDLRGGRGGNLRRGDAVDVLRVPLVQVRHDRGRRGSVRDLRQKGEVLDKSDGVSFGRLGRADVPPLRGVEKTGASLLTSTVNRRVQTTQVTEGAVVRQPVQHLRHSGADARVACASAPVARGHGVAEGVRHAVGALLHLLPRLELLALVHAGLQLAGQLLRDLSDGDAEESGHEGACGVGTLVSEEVTVVFGTPSEEGLQQLVDHETDEVHLLQLAEVLHAHVGQQLGHQHLLRVLDTLRLLDSLLLAGTTSDEVERKRRRLDEGRPLQRGTQRLEHVSVVEVVDDVLHDEAVGREAEGAEHHDHGDVDADVRQRGLQAVSAARLGQRGQHSNPEGRRRPVAAFEARPDLAREQVLVRLLLLEDENVVVRLALLRHENLLRAVAHEVAALVVRALAGELVLGVRDVVKVAEVGAEHERHVAQIHLLELLLVLQDQLRGVAAGGVLAEDGEVDVDQQLRLVREVAQTTLVREGLARGGAVALLDHGTQHVHLSQLEVTVLGDRLLLARHVLRVLPADDGGLLVDQLLDGVEHEVVEAVELLPQKTLLLEVRRHNLPDVVLVDLVVAFVHKVIVGVAAGEVVDGRFLAPVGGGRRQRRHVGPKTPFSKGETSRGPPSPLSFSTPLSSPPHVWCKPRTSNEVQIL